MQDWNLEDSIDAARPRTITVLGYLTVAAAMISWLGAYALTRALVSADLLMPWPSEGDPRPRWLAESFLTLLASFILLSGLLRFLSRRQLRRIDAISDDG